MSRIIAGRVLPIILMNYLLQWAFAAIFIPLKNDKFFDISGAAGFIVATYTSLYGPYLKDRYWHGKGDTVFPPFGSFAFRQVLLSVAVFLWAARLGTFLLKRAFRDGTDEQMKAIRTSPSKFFFLWTLQATWISLVGLPVYVANCLPPSAHPSLDMKDYYGISLFAISFAVEAIADNQKTAWKYRKIIRMHDQKFINEGLWTISRHPNYVGEVGVWTGIWVLASNAMMSRLLPPGFLFGTTISPLFTYYSLTKITGVPHQETKAEKRFGDDPKWKAYKKNVPIFFPWGQAGDFKP